MGAALGMILGTGLQAIGGYANQKLQEKQQHEQSFQQFFDNSLKQDPVGMAEFLKTPDGQKFAQRRFGKEMAEPAMQMIGLASQHFQKQQADVQKAMSGAGGGDRISGLMQAEAATQDPAQQRMLHGAIGVLQRQEALKQQAQEQEANRQQRAQAHQDMMQMHQETMAQAAQFKESMIALQQAREADAKQQSISTAGEKISGYWANLAKMMASQNPPDEGTLNTLVAQGNAMARQLKARAAAAGVDPDPDVTQTLTVQQVPGWWQRHTGGRLGGTTPELTPEMGAKSGGGADPLIGTSTKAPDGPHTIGGKKYIVKNGKVEAG